MSLKEADYSDLLIITRQHHHQHSGNQKNHHLCFSTHSLLTQQFQSIQRERISKNQQIYDHIQLLMKQSTPKNFIEKNPFPDNNCKLAILKALICGGELLEYASDELKDDEFVVLRAVKKKTLAMKFASQRLKENRDFVIKILKSKLRLGNILDHIPYFHNDDEIARLAIQQHPQGLKYASSLVKSDRNLLLNAAKKDGTILEYVPEDLKDREMVMECTKNYQHVCPLQFAPMKFRNDPDIVLSAAKSQGFVYSYASNELRSDRDFALKILKIKGDCLRYVSAELLGDREIVLEAVKSSGNALFFADYMYRSDFEIAAIALSSDTFTISSLGVDLKSSPEFVLNNCSSPQNVANFIEYSNSYLANDTYFVNELIDTQCKYSISSLLISNGFKAFNTDQLLRITRIDPKVIDYLTDINEILAKRQLVLDLIMCNRKILQKLTEELRNDREIISLALKKHYGALQFASAELKNDKDIVMEAIRSDATNFQFVSEELKQDEEILEFAISKDASNFKYAPESWRNDRDLVLEVVRQSKKNIVQYLGYELKRDRDLIFEICRLTSSLENIPQEFIQDREIVLTVIQNKGDQFKNVPRSLLNDRELLIIALRNGFSLRYLDESEIDREIVLEACKFNTNNLIYAPEKFRDDPETIKASLNKVFLGSSFMERISERLKNNEEFMRELVKINGIMFLYVPESMKNDKPLFISALTNPKWMMALLIHASPELLNDKEVVLTALQYSKSAYRFASDELKNDEEVLLAVRKWLPTKYLDGSLIIDVGAVLLLLNEKSLKSFSYNFKNDRQFCLLAVNINVSNLLYVSNRLKLDRTFILEIEPENFDILYVPIRLREDREIALKFLEGNGESIMHIPKLLQTEFRNSREIMLKAIKSNEIAFVYASEELQNDQLFILEAASLNGNILQYVPLKFTHNREIVLKCTQNHPAALRFIPSEFLNDREIILNAVSHKKSTTSLLNHISFELRHDKEIVLKAVQCNYNDLAHAPDEITSDEEFISQAVDINIEALRHAHYLLRYNPEFLRRLNKDNRIVENCSFELQKSIDFASLLV